MIKTNCGTQEHITQIAKCFGKLELASFLALCLM